MFPGFWGLPGYLQLHIHELTTKQVLFAFQNLEAVKPASRILPEGGFPEAGSAENPKINWGSTGYMMKITSAASCKHVFGLACKVGLYHTDFSCSQ